MTNETGNWAPLERTPDGIDEIDAAWVAAHRADLQIIDVREPDEFAGPLGHIEAAVAVPLGELPHSLGRIGRDRPIVTVCLVGGRSALAFALLRHRGFDRVANLAGGMKRWHELGLPVVRES